MLGLKWEDVELDRNRILVRRQLEAVTDKLRDTKTKAGCRFVVRTHSHLVRRARR
jgi:hypothetical protein